MSSTPSGAGLDTERHAIALACRVLAARDLAPGILGHISLRVDRDRLLIRCRGPRERGLAFTSAEDIRMVTLDGTAGGKGELDDGYQPPNELPLHTEVLRTRRDVNAVVHAHPEAVVAADLAGLAVRPIVGAFDIPGFRLAAAGVPVYRRGVLVRNRQLAQEMVAAMADRPVVVLRAHGLTSAAETVERAVLQAISVDTISRLSLQIASAGGTLADLPDADAAELPDLGNAFNETIAWRHELGRLETHGLSCHPSEKRSS
ncbi:class II aldolase/adducin family protein [Mycobacterium hodleri]|uniref:Aldolase n=2 Tax=Mycobacteriaceae TaxID=1762 RepID=A0A064C9G9_9MYCO|nr:MULTISPECIES: class II aldolase/adducin family protein [Mycolicibacterium]SBS77785.1 3,4-dihydroxyphthalate decarboxylase [uncultured Mycobacterium sp.]KDE96985.1 aldolase [Mycolicibacterium aromaticivorans JS19b1 = JCM 16368]MCV7137473.1 class II aldolase/adducin family protein [Mycolicibacterium hodleri]MCV7155796.1 class II aldolase/adducin family protein [Mycolicibacterium pyrenivorans]MCV7283717.1 class II aldolase/adducin family protein [Mycolicibacterium flavescens]